MDDQKLSVKTIDLIGVVATSMLIGGTMFIGVEYGGIFEEGGDFITKALYWVPIWISIHFDHLRKNRVSKRK